MRARAHSLRTGGGHFVKTQAAVKGDPAAPISTDDTRQTEGDGAGVKGAETAWRAG